MKTFTTCIVSFALMMAGIGCKGKTAFHVSTSSGWTRIELGGQECILWSSATKMPTYSSENLYRLFGSHPVADGQSVQWRCQTEDGRTFTKITIDSRSYDLKAGQRFHLSIEDGEVKVIQSKEWATPEGEV